MNDKEKYILHIENLKYVIKLGIRVLRFHRVLRFEQKPFLKPYVQMNSQLRIQATNTFEKTLFKFLNNSIYGKTMQNTRKHKKIYIINDWKQAKKLIDKPHFNRSKIIDENSVVIQMKKTQDFLTQPIYVGASILDLSKLYMQQLHYDRITRGLKTSLCYTGGLRKISFGRKVTVSLSYFRHG